MPAVNSYLIRSKINETLFNDGLFWLGSPIGASVSAVDPSLISSSLGKGPLQRLHFKNNPEVELVITTMITKSVKDISGAKTDSFDLFDYYYNLINTEGIIRTGFNKPILTGMNLSFTPNNIIVGRFTNRIINADESIIDYIEELEEPEGIGSGDQAIAYENVELPVLSGAQFFKGVSSVTIGNNVEIVPLLRPGGIYGYYYGQPFNVDLNIDIYEKHFQTFESFFKDVENLQDIEIGPFKVTKTKMVSSSSSVDAGGFKQNSVSLRGKNIIYNNEV